MNEFMNYLSNGSDNVMKYMQSHKNVTYTTTGNAVDPYVADGSDGTA